MQLKASEKYSKNVCESCHDQLNSFSNFQKELIKNQIQLYKFEESLNTEICDLKIEVDNEHASSLTVDYPNMKVFIKIEPQHNEHCTTEDLLTRKNKVNDPFPEPTKLKNNQNTTDNNE